jgi:hypothetical protein
MAKGTLSMRASVLASSVLPEPVGPISRMLLLSSSTLPASLALHVEETLVVVVHRDREGSLGVVLPDHVLIEELLDLARRGDLAQRESER